MFTLGFGFYDPKVPYIYQSINGKPSIRFLFNTRSGIAGMPTADEVLALWKTAEHLPAPGQPMSVVGACKRTIWERRFALSHIASDQEKLPAEFPDGYYLTDDLRVAILSYAFGYVRPRPWINWQGKGMPTIYAVGGLLTGWNSGKSPSDIERAWRRDCEYIEQEGNETDILAVSLAAYINIAAWLDHLRTARPYVQFLTPSGKSYWVREGTEKWRELVDAGYSPT